MKRKVKKCKKDEKSRKKEDRKHGKKKTQRRERGKERHFGRSSREHTKKTHTHKTQQNKTKNNNKKRNKKHTNTENTQENAPPECRDPGKCWGREREEGAKLRPPAPSLSPPPRPPDPSSPPPPPSSPSLPTPPSLFQPSLSLKLLGLNCVLYCVGCNLFEPLGMRRERRKNEIFDGRGKKERNFGRSSGEAVQRKPVWRRGSGEGRSCGGPTNEKMGTMKKN